MQEVWEDMSLSSCLSVLAQEGASKLGPGGGDVDVAEGNTIDPPLPTATVKI
jgi:hypothetical protein